MPTALGIRRKCPMCKARVNQLFAWRGAGAAADGWVTLHIEVKKFTMGCLENICFSVNKKKMSQLQQMSSTEFTFIKIVLCLMDN